MEVDLWRLQTNLATSKHIACKQTVVQAVECGTTEYVVIETRAVSIFKPHHYTPVPTEWATNKSWQIICQLYFSSNTACAIPGIF